MCANITKQTIIKNDCRNMYAKMFTFTSFFFQIRYFKNRVNQGCIAMI